MRLNSLIEPGDPERIASGFEFTEGPVWHPDGYLLFSDIPAARIYQWKPDGTVVVWRERSGNSNGLTLDRQVRLIACEHGNRRVSRTEENDVVLTVADRYEGKRLNSPNDVVVKSDGTIYFTDPPYGIEPDQREQSCNGVYRILADGTLELVADDFDRPNGLAFSPDEAVLYIDNSARRHVRAFDVRPDGTLANSRVIADMDHPQPGSPDGHEARCRGASVRHRRDGRVGVRARRHAPGRDRDAGAAGQLRLGRRRPADAVYHRANVAVPDSDQGAGSAGAVRVSQFLNEPGPCYVLRVASH